MSASVLEPRTFGMSLHVSVTVAPENAEKFLAALRPCLDAVIKEPECIFFEVYQDPEKSGRFKWVEDWTKDKDWFLQVPQLIYLSFLLGPSSIGVLPPQIWAQKRLGDDLLLL